MVIYLTGLWVFHDLPRTLRLRVLLVTPLAAALVLCTMVISVAPLAVGLVLGGLAILNTRTE